MKRIILCADDFARSEPISEGITALVEMGRLSAVSCMTEGLYWQHRNNRLPQLRDRIDIGLHFNLTQGFVGPGEPPMRVLRDALMGKLSRQRIETSLHDQLDRFESVMGDAPDFVDSHEHVHLFPTIRIAMLQTLARRYRHRLPWLRQVNVASNRGARRQRKLMVEILGWGFAGAARRYGFELNRSCSGMYAPHRNSDFGALMRRWLDRAADGELIICHPTKPDGDDDVATAHSQEYAWLASDAFGDALTEMDIKLARFHEITPRRGPLQANRSS